MCFDADTGHFELAYEGRRDAAPHWIVVPPDYPESFDVRCDGQPIDPTPVRDPALARIVVVCAHEGAHTLTIDPR
jgi:hypothetical protein